MKNKRFFILILSLVTLLTGLKSQDNILDLQKANRLLSVAQERDRVAAEDLEEVKSRRLRLEEDLIDLQDKPNATAKAEKKKIETELKTLRKREEDLRQRRKYANNLLLDVTDILQAAPKKRAKYIVEYEKRFGPITLKETVVNQEVTTVLPPSVSAPKTGIDPIAHLENQAISPQQPVEENPVVAPETPKPDAKKKKKDVQKKPQTKVKPNTEAVAAQSKPKAESKTKNKKEKQPKTIVPKPIETESVQQNDIVIVTPEPQKEPKKEPKKKKQDTKPATAVRTESSKTVMNYKKFDPKDDVLLTTPTSLDCNLAFDGMDSFTGKKKQETTPIILFAHTDDFMRATMKNKEFVTCEATATRVEGSRTVYLNLTMTILSKDAQRTFGFLDRGALIIFRFINGKKMSLTTNKTDIGIVDVDKGTTTFRAQLAIGETIEMTASELDAIRVSWSVGYEDYEIFDMDVLRNLFKCLDKK